MSSGSSLFFPAQILNQDFLFGPHDVSIQTNTVSCSLGTERRERGGERERETRRKRTKGDLNMHFNGGANIFQIGRKQTGVRYSTGQQPDWGCDVRRDERSQMDGERGEEAENKELDIYIMSPLLLTVFPHVFL